MLLGMSDFLFIFYRKRREPVSKAIHLGKRFKFQPKKKFMRPRKFSGTSP
jgi:hypothetical protein